jgi:hypothetical protein
MNPARIINGNKKKKVTSALTGITGSIPIPSTYITTGSGSVSTAPIKVQLAESLLLENYAKPVAQNSISVAANTSFQVYAALDLGYFKINTLTFHATPDSSAMTWTIVLNGVIYAVYSAGGLVDLSALFKGVIAYPGNLLEILAFGTSPLGFGQTYEVIINVDGYRVSKDFAENTTDQVPK